jgi:hypothetical protein
MGLGAVLTLYGDVLRFYGSLRLSAVVNVRSGAGQRKGPLLG